MEVTEVTDPQDFNISTEEALISALTPKRLGELQLQPYALMRQTVALQLCDGESDSSFFRAVMTVWLCTLSELEVLRARKDIEQSQIKAFAWGDTRGYSLINYKPLLDVYKQLTDEIAPINNVQLRDGDSAVKKTTGEQPRP